MQKYQNKADVFSFGLSLIEWFNTDNINKLPQNGDLWHKIRNEKPSSFITFPWQDLADLIDNMTSNALDQRFTIDDVLDNQYLKRLINEISYLPSKDKVNLRKLII